MDRSRSALGRRFFSTGRSEWLKRTARVEALETRALLSSTSITVEVPASGSVEFSGPGRTFDTLVFQHCSGDVTLVGSNLTQTAARNGTPIVSGTISAVQQIDVTGSTGNASLVFRGVASKTPMELDGFSATASLHSLMLGGMSLDGTLDTEGTATAQLGTIEANSSLHFGAAPSGSAVVSSLNLTTRGITDAMISSDLPIGQLKTGGFIATVPYDSGTAGSAGITAPSIQTWRAAGDLSGDVNLTGAGTTDLGTLVAGDVTAGSWDINGNAGRVTVESIAAAMQFQVIGTLQNLKTFGDEDGTLFLGAANTINIGGNMGGGMQISNSYAANVYDLNVLHVNGVILDGYLLSSGNINSISAVGMNGAFISAGLDSSFEFTALPQPTDLTTPARIKTITLRTKAAQFQKSVVAASLLGNLKLGVIAIDDNGTPFGLTADEIQSLVCGAVINKKGKYITLRQATGSTLSTQLQRERLTPADLQDFTINL